MHIVVLSYYFDTDIQTTKELVERYSSTLSISEAVKAAGGERITVVQRFSQSHKKTYDGIDYYFIADGLPNRLNIFHNPRKVNVTVSDLKPDVVHFNGFPYHMKFLRRVLSPQCAIVWQHHGGGIPSIPKRPFIKRWLRTADALIFNSIEQGKEWKAAGIIDKHQKLFEVIENSSNFKPLSREVSIRKLGLSGSPILLWVGRLIPDKDPLTVINGFSRIRKTLPDAQLYLIYQDDTLSEQCRKLVDKLGLNDSVHFVGAVRHQELELYYNAADYFVLGSHHEGSGWSLIEAIACGTPTVVTDIPPFRKITGNNITGGLWKPGDPQSFAGIFLKTYSNPPLRESIRQYFQNNLSYDVIGQQMYSAYGEITNHCTEYIQRKDHSIPVTITSTHPSVAMFVPAGISRFNEGIHIPNLYRLVAYLSERVNMTVYTFQSRGYDIRHEKCGNAEIKYLPVGLDSHWLIKCKKLYAAIHKDHNENNYDVIHGLYGLPTEIATILSGKKLRIPTVISFLGGETARIKEHHYGNLRKQPERYLTRWIIKHAQVVTLLSQYQLTLLPHQWLKNARIRIIPLGVDTTTFFPADKNWQSPINILHVGNINPLKDHTTLLQAFNIIVQKADCRLRIIGMDLCNGSVEKLANELGISDRVEFLGLKSYEEMPEQYRWAHILLQTSIYEGGGVAVTEAAASGVVLAGTNVGLLSDFSNDKAITVPVKDPEALAAKVIQIIQAPESFSGMRKAALQWARNFDLTWTATQYLRIYRDLSRGKQVPDLEDFQARLTLENKSTIK